MSTSQSLIDQAREKYDEAKRRVLTLAEELEEAKADEMGWEEFLARASMLAEKTNAEKVETTRKSKVSVIKDSIVGRAVAVLLARTEPVPLKALARAIIQQYDPSVTDERYYRSTLNTAMWRRKDVFKRTQDGYVLTTTDIAFK